MQHSQIANSFSFRVIYIEGFKAMEKYQNRGQGTLNSILMLVLLFLLVDILIAVIMYFDIKLDAIIPSTDNSANIQVTVVTDNTSKTDNN